MATRKTLAVKPHVAITNGKMRTYCRRIITVFVISMTFSVCAETDIYGNEIKTYVEGGVTKTYKFWVSGTQAEIATFANSMVIPSSSGSLCTGTLSAPAVEAVSLEARFRTWLNSLGTALKSTRFCGFFLDLR